MFQIKIIYTTDLHGIKGLYFQLFQLAIDWQPDVVIVGGDILPKHGPFYRSIENQRDFIVRFLRYELKEIHKKLPEVEIYGMMGNDDWIVTMPYLAELQSYGLLKLLHTKKYMLEREFEIIGYGNVPPTPFSNKDSERIDTADLPMEAQNVAACISTESGIITIDPEHHFRSHHTIEEELVNLPVPNSFQRTVYVMHSPPFGTKLDVLHNGRPAGSHAIRRFIEKKQPFLTLHGHVHESPLVSGSYWDTIGDTLCLNSGQSINDLHAVVFELEDVENTMKHTIFQRNSSPKKIRHNNQK